MNYILLFFVVYSAPHGASWYSQWYVQPLVVSITFWFLMRACRAQRSPSFRAAQSWEPWILGVLSITARVGSHRGAHVAYWSIDITERGALVAYWSERAHTEVRTLYTGTTEAHVHIYFRSVRTHYWVANWGEQNLYKQCTGARGKNVLTQQCVRICAMHAFCEVHVFCTVSTKRQAQQAARLRAL
jgi:hypothetical protein